MENDNTIKTIVKVSNKKNDKILMCYCLFFLIHVYYSLSSISMRYN